MFPLLGFHGFFPLLYFDGFFGLSSQINNEIFDRDYCSILEIFDRDYCSIDE